MADKKISQLDLVAQINNDAVIPMSQENGGEQTTYKALITALGEKIAEGMTFSNLATTAKNLVGAINELKASGAPIIIGTTAPSSGQGADGNIYIKYTEGTGGADDTVDSIYVKLDGTWCEAQTDYADLLNKPSVNGNTLSGNKTTSDLGIYGSNINMASDDSTKVKDRITALETVESDSLPITTYGGTILCKKVGRVVTVHAYEIGKTSALPTSAATTFGSLPEKYRPLNDIQVSGSLNLGSYDGGAAQFYRIQTSGSILTYGYSGKVISNGTFIVTYIV